MILNGFIIIGVTILWISLLPGRTFFQQGETIILAMLIGVDELTPKIVTTWSARIFVIQ